MPALSLPMPPPSLSVCLPSFSSSSLSLCFKETKTFKCLIYFLKNQAQKASWILNSSYNTTFWWFKCKWSRNIWIPFSITHTRSFKNQGEMCSAQHILFGWTQNFWKILGVWWIQNIYPSLFITLGGKPLIHGDSKTAHICWVGNQQPGQASR